MFGLISDDPEKLVAADADCVCLIPSADELSGISATRVAQLVFAASLRAREICLSLHETLGVIASVDLEATQKLLCLFAAQLTAQSVAGAGSTPKRFSVAIFPVLQRVALTAGAAVSLDYEKTAAFCDALRAAGVGVFCLPLDRLLGGAEHDVAIGRLAEVFDGFYVLKAAAMASIPKNKEIRYVVNEEEADAESLKNFTYRPFESDMSKDAGRHTLLPMGVVRCTENAWRIL